MTREQQMQDMMTAAFWRDIEEGNQPDNGDAIEIAKTYERAYQQGWRDADQHPHWIPVEERLPRINDVASTWDCSDDVYVYLATRSCCVGRYENDKLTNEFYWVLYGVDKDIPVTHWMEIVPPRKEDKVKLTYTNN